MQDRPSARELIEAVVQFLERELVPSVTDARLKFRARVAANVLTIVTREMEQGDALLHAEWERLHKLLDFPSAGKDVCGEIEQMTRELCRRIRAGEADEGPWHDAVMAHVTQTVIEKLQIANPRYLERVSKE